MQSVISLRNLHKTFPGFTLDIPKLDIPQGYITGFIGENGSGKTTTLRMIMDIVKPDIGEITVLGKEIPAHAPTLKQDIGYVDSLAYFSPYIPLGKAKAMIAPFYRNWDEELYQHYIKHFALPEKKKLKALSSGQNKLFSLIMALCHHPKLLILDEPTTALDPIIRNELLDILAELLQDGTTSVFFSTHITSDLDKTADYIAYIQSGRLILFDEKDRLLDEYRIVKGENHLLDKADGLLIGAQRSSVGFTALTRESHRVAQQFGDSVVMEKPNLEEIMIYTAEQEDVCHA